MAETERMQTRLAPDDANRVRLWAEQNSLSNSEAVRRLVRSGLRQKDTKVPFRTIVMFAPVRALVSGVLFLLYFAVGAVGVFFFGAAVLTLLFSTTGGPSAFTFAAAGLGILFGGALVLATPAIYISKSALDHVRAELLADETVGPTTSKPADPATS